MNIFTCALRIPLDLLKSAKSKLSHRQRAVVATRGDKFRQKSVILSQNFLRFFQLLDHFARVATHAIFTERWRRDNFQKIASQSRAQNRLCVCGLSIQRRGVTDGCGKSMLETWRHGLECAITKRQTGLCTGCYYQDGLVRSKRIPGLLLN